MHKPACPRCGYELTGLLASYTEACPTEAVCSECGCSFRWSEVASPILGPWWFAERSGRGVMRRAFLTALTSLLPWRFWRSLKMEHPIRPRGIADAQVASVVLLLIWSAVIQAVMIIIGQLVTMNFDWDVWSNYYLHNVLWPFGGWEHDSMSYGVVRYSRQDLSCVLLPSLVVPIVTALSVPIMFCVPVTTRASHGVRMAHVFRITLYGLPGLGFALVAVVSLRTAMFVAMEVCYASPQGFGPNWLHELSDDLLSILSTLVILVTVMWQSVWWTVATRHYLRFNRPGAFAWPLVGVSLFAGVVALVVLAASMPGVVLYLLGLDLW